ncbi:flavoprotein [Hirsutella rhossiliensis]|uniref:Flavoprotein n=1 Tax=Hirsutella rhossiliensis TaxID=111463 RepID=A0A9P8SDJ2_9HYPO|nr:flavoprotein [Hirsutella rhossiliensis]KAH0958651.1 flavoprotein [Hirsutella rhossiliensis]
MKARDARLRLLVASTGPRDTSWAQALVVRLSKHPQIEARAIVDDVVPRLTQTIIVMGNQSLTLGQGQRTDDIEFYRQQAYELVEWADLMVCVPLDADAIAKMLAGIADTLLGEVLRGWDTRKNVVLVPGMSTHMWANPTTKCQLNKLHRKWSWIRVMAPILWHYEGTLNPRRVLTWNGFNGVLDMIKNQADLLGLGRDAEIAAGPGMAFLDSRSPGDKIKARLPPEIWTVVLDFAGDWELAQALGIYTNLPVPQSWCLASKDSGDPLKVYEHELEWTVLAGSATAACKKLSQSPPNFQDLSALVVKLVIRFALTEVLEFMEVNRPDLFRVFDGTVLPTNASAHYPRVDVLEYWRKSKWFRGKRVYDAEAVDGASRNGHVWVLDWWWRRSGLPLRYTETALEQASGRGQLPVLEWWRDAAAQDQQIVLRPGRSLLWATQHGQAEVLRWWDGSGIPAAHGEGVAKTASRWGRVDVLETWRRLQGEGKLFLDAEALVSATVHQHIEVLEWWRRFAQGELEGMDGRKQAVDFRASNMEEVLEDSSGSESRARRWWAQHGQDLGMRRKQTQLQTR